MPSQHAAPSFSVRLRADLREPLAAHLAASGRAKNELINTAIEKELRDMSAINETVTDQDIADLEGEAGGAGDLEMARICERALGILDEGIAEERAEDEVAPEATAKALAMTPEQARAECERVIRETRREFARD